MAPYFPHTEADVQSMLEKAGLKSLDDLYSDVPSEFLHRGAYQLPDALSEQELRDWLHSLDSQNAHLKVFVGQGAYDHYTPSVIPYLTQRSEFLTAYTPYQAEISQGTLQYIFEYQSMMAELTGMEVSNASMYDGTTATAEAMMMAVAAAKKRSRVLISDTISPYVLRVVKTYAKYQGIQVDMIPAKDGETDHEALKAELEKEDVAGVIVATPNFYGIVEDYTGVADLCHEHKALFIIHCVATALSVVRTPGEWGADIAVGDGQSLGIPLSYGGPYVGFLCTSKKLIRKMPGRIVGATRDADGKRAFVLTLQAREQHIRREKATSNICSNQSLMALYVTVYMSLMGAKGLREVNAISYSMAHYLAETLTSTGLFEMAYPGKPFLCEFAVKTKLDIDQLQAFCNSQFMQCGLKIADDTLLLAVTETYSREDCDNLVEACVTFNKEQEG